LDGAAESRGLSKAPKPDFSKKVVKRVFEGILNYLADLAGEIKFKDLTLYLM
jgi:hypothetical protein